MRRLGLLGGMSWESTTPYYVHINRFVARYLGGLRSADLVLRSVDFGPIEQMQREDRWDEAGGVLAEAARGLERAGAEAVLLCCNTMHKVAPAIEAAIDVPFLHIADAVADEAARRGIGRATLVGTAYTMESAFIRDRLAKAGLEVDVPAAAHRDAVHRIIYQELCRGVVTDDARRHMRELATESHRGGSGALVLGCTELAMLTEGGVWPLPMLDSAEIHARSAAAWSLGVSPALAEGAAIS